MLSDKPAVVGAAALAGGGIGGVTGFASGKREAASENSKLLALRRLGINTPGELDMLNRAPSTYEDMEATDMTRSASAQPLSKRAQSWLLSNKVLPLLLRGGAGAAYGYQVTPRMLGFSDNPEARSTSALLDAVLFAAAPGVIQHAKATTGSAAGATKGLATGYVASHLIPRIQANMDDSRRASQLGAAASIMQANSAKTTSIPHNLREFLQSNTARGLTAGAGVAGLAGLLTGLLRVKSEREEQDRAGRPEMIGRDTLRYLLPAMAAGGVAGSLWRRKA
jgi:hypothetical protein